MSDVTNLRQSEAKVFVEGKVSDISLEQTKDDKGEELIKGSVTVKTSETNFVQFSTYVKKHKKDGTENITYPGLVTVMNEYRSIAKDGDENADWIRVSGDLNPYTQQNTGRSVVGYRSNFFTRVKGEPDPKAEFRVELFVKSVTPELGTDGEETGRIKISGWMPTYNGIEPLDLMVDEDSADDAASYFEPGNTHEFWGDVVANQVREEKTIEAGFGKSRVETRVSFRNELVCTGGSEPYDEDDEKRPPYDANAIKLAVQQREDRLKEQQNKAQGSAVSKKPSGAASGRTLSF